MHFPFQSPCARAGILATLSERDQADMAARGYGNIDLVVCNLYPFEKTVAKEGVKIEDAVENIDIGVCVCVCVCASPFVCLSV